MESWGSGVGGRALGSMGDAVRVYSLTLPPYTEVFQGAKAAGPRSIFYPCLSFSSSSLAAMSCPRQLPPLLALGCFYSPLLYLLKSWQQLVVE